jgi:hypothetical protein
MKEYKVNEIFKHNLLDMEFKESNSSIRCNFCFFENTKDCGKFACTSKQRSDNKIGFYQKIGCYINPISILTSPYKFDL